MRRIVACLLIGWGLLWTAQSAWAVRAKLRITFPVGGQDNATGFDNGTLGTSGFGITLVSPVSADTQIGFGYTYFRARMVAPPESSERYVATTTAHLLSLGGEYTGIELLPGYDLLLGLSVDFPISGQGEVKSDTGAEESSASGLSGAGTFLNAGITNRRWEVFGYYQQLELSYHNLTVTRSGNSEEVKLNLQSFGIGLGYLF